MNLSDQEKIKFSNIIFTSNGREKEQISRLNEEQLMKIKSIYAQKISYDSVNSHILPPPQIHHHSTQEHAPKPGLITTVCCCFFPENNRDSFDITTTVFLSRVLETFLFWRADFLTVHHKVELYGTLWLTLTYIVILGLSANLNEYFILPQNYQFRNEFMASAVGITLIFKFSEPLIYSAVIRCLGSYIPTNESLMLTGYSVILYFIPTLACFIPSLYWHMGMLGLGSFFRSIFLFRNYSVKLQSKTYILLIVIYILQALFCYILLKVIFYNDFGYSFNDGTNRVFNNHNLIRKFMHKI